MIKNAQEWFTSILYDIDSKSKEVKGDSKESKEELAIMIDRLELERKHFGMTLKEYLKEIQNEK